MSFTQLNCVTLNKIAQSSPKNARILSLKYRLGLTPSMNPISEGSEGVLLSFFKSLDQLKKV